MSKPTAKKAAPAKKPVGKSAAAAPKGKPKAGVKAPAKAAAKPAHKPAAKPAAKAPAKKSPAKPAAKPRAKAAPKPAAKPAPKTTIASKTALTTSTPKAVAKPAAAAVPQIAVTAPMADAAAPKPLTKAQSKAKAAASSPLPPAPSTSASRFADRFAPAKPARLMAMPEAMRPTFKADPKLVNAWKSKAGRDLTEGELLAMPEAEYMNDKQLEFFRARLSVLKDDLLSNAGETTEHLREDTSIVPDPADRATIEEEHALELRTRDRERKLLKKITQSLSRIEAGDYGYCDETGEPIGLARLLARPTATLSLEAQQRREMKQKMFGD